MAYPKQLTLIRWFVLLLFPLIWSAASYLGFLDFLENKLVDWRFRARGEIAAPIKVIYVNVDSESITGLGNQPWNRGYYAEVCDALLHEGQVKAVGIDILVSEKAQADLLDVDRFLAGNRRLAKFLFDSPAPPVVLAASYAAAEDRDINGTRIVRILPRVERPTKDPQPPELPEFRFDRKTVINPPNVGLIDALDGGTRWVPLFAKVGDLTYFHMALELARLYWGLPRDAVQIFSDHVELRRGSRVFASIPLRHGQDVEVNWFSPWSSAAENPWASFGEVLVHARALHSDMPSERESSLKFFDQFKNAVVLIGPTDPLLQDIAPTPLDLRPVPRVSIHGNLLKTIVSGEYLHGVTFFWQAFLIIALTALVAVLAIGVGRVDSTWSRILAIAVMLGYVGLAFIVFLRWHWVLPLTAPVLSAFSTSFVGVIWQLVREEKQKGRIKSMFGTYVSPELVNRMVESGEDPKLGGTEASITAYFSDIQNFSTFAEKLTPPQLVELMNEYLTACTDIITAHGGTLDKYIGDAVVAMFGAPVALSDHAYRACIASQRVQLRLAELRKEWSRTGSRWPDTVGSMKTRVGLNSGAAVVGNMGSQTRFNYTMMGDSVNLAARLESGAKTYGVCTLVTEATKKECEKWGNECVFRFLDRIVVKGRSGSVAIYELAGLRSSLVASELEYIAIFERGMVAYLGQDWKTANDEFTSAAKLEAEQSAPLDPSPCRVYLQRCRLLAETPITHDWDGVWVMPTK